MPAKPEREPIELEGYLIKLVEQYKGIGPLGDVQRKGEWFGSKEEADRALPEVKRLLNEVGKWERLTEVAAAVRDAVAESALKPLKSIRFEDLEFAVPPMSDFVAMRSPFRISFGLSRKASEESRAERPWLLDVDTWASAFKNLERWRALRESLRALLQPV